MATFYDDFERANGAPGGNWTAIGGTPTISNAALTGSAFWGAYNTTVTDPHRQEVSAHLQWVDANSGYSGVGTNKGAGQVYGYTLRVQYANSVYNLRLYKGSVAGSPTLLAEQVDVATPSLSYFLRLVNTDGHLVGTYGESTVEADDATYAEGQYCGVHGYGSSGRCLDFAAVGGAALAFSVTPAVVGNYGGTTSMTATGTNTSWGAGTPGTPTFTVDHGRLLNQVVESATSATFDYEPGTFLGTAIFTDPSTGATCGVTVTSDPAIISPGSAYQFTPQAVAMVNNTAGESWVERLTKPSTPVEVDAYSTLELETVLGTIALNTGAKITPSGVPAGGLLTTLWELINGAEAYTETQDLHSLIFLTKADVADIWTRTGLGKTGGSYNVGTLLREISGYPGGSIQDVLTAIAGLDPGGSVDFSAVLTAIEELRGDTTTTVSQLLTVLAQIRTVSTLTLGDVVNAANNVRGSGSPTVKDVRDDIAALHNAPAFDDTAVLGAISSNTDIVSAIKTALLLYLGPEGATVQLLLDAISGIEGGDGGLHSPLLDASLTLTELDPIAFDDPFVADVECHGLRYAISTHAQGVKGYSVGDYTALTGAGVVAFLDPDGYPEPYQYINWDHGLIVPKTMTKAAGFIYSSHRGLTGTVTPFSLEAPA